MVCEMTNEIKAAVEEYQCPGCLCGSGVEGCYRKSTISGSGCGKHTAGTHIMPGGTIYLGMPIGFCRIGPIDQSVCPMLVFTTPEEFNEEWTGYDVFNIPVWKHLNENGHTLVRGLSPRNNMPFIHVHLYNCMDKVNCPEVTQEITQQMIDRMD